MRKVPASVAVITVASHDAATNKHVPLGIAVSSLNTVTLDPPTVSFNIKQPSKALDAIRAANGRFRVHFLNGEGFGAKVIELFCKGNHPDAYDHRMRDLRIRVPQLNDEEIATASFAPQIQGKGVRAAAECTLTQELVVADHVILVAQVNSLDGQQDLDIPTIAYVDGTYRRLDGTVISSHGKKQSAEQPVAEQDMPDSSVEESIAYDYPLFPGEKERHEFVERLKVHFKDVETGRPTKEIILEIHPKIRLVAQLFGVDLEALVHFCQHTEVKKGQQIVPEFYGQLSTARLAKVVDRAKQLVRADPRFLDARYSDLLRYLDVFIGKTDLLPSDILIALRAEGLAGPVQPPDKFARNIFAVEQAEHLVREYLSTLTDKEIIRTPFKSVVREAGVPDWVHILIRGSHTRLKVETCSRFYKDWKMDITGDVSPEEARVVARRLIDYIGIGRPDYQTHRYEDVSAMMRNVGVHPLITGMNARAMLSKIRHIYTTHSHLPFPKLKVAEMLQPYFALNVTWEDLQTRIKHFVQKLPLRAITWNDRDKLAAMGLSGETIISTSLSSRPQTLDESNLLETLFAKALKNHYGHGTDEENKAIAAFLQDQYNFDVVRRTVVATPAEVVARSSADDMEAARLEHEQVPVQIGRKSRRH